MTAPILVTGGTGTLGRLVVTRLRAAGLLVTLKVYERPSHTTLIGAMSAPLRWIAPVHEDVLAFIRARRAD